MWAIKRVNSDYYYSHLDRKSDLPVYTREIGKAQLYPTKKRAKNSMRFGDVMVKVDNCKERKLICTTESN